VESLSPNYLFLKNKNAPLLWYKKCKKIIKKSLKVQKNVIKNAKMAKMAYTGT